MLYILLLFLFFNLCDLFVLIFFARVTIDATNSTNALVHLSPNLVYIPVENTPHEDIPEDVKEQQEEERCKHLVLVQRDQRTWHCIHHTSQ